MKCIITNSYNEFIDAIINAEKEGLKVAAISNAGLESHQRRITLLPKSEFTNPNPINQNGPARCNKEPINMNEFIKGLEK